MSTRQSTRNGSVDLFRFMLICIIVLYHYTARYPQIYADIDFSFRLNKGGSIGNFMFMLLSGYFLTHSLFKDSGIKKLFRFCANKWWRFFPTAVICMVIIFVATRLSPLPDDRMVNLPTLFANFLIINLGFKQVDGAHWFFSTLLQMQLILSFLLLIRDMDKRKIIMVLICLLSFGLYLIYDMPDTRIDNLLMGVTCSNWLPILLSGSIIYLVLKKQLKIGFAIVPAIVSLKYTYDMGTIFIPFLIAMFILLVTVKMPIKSPKSLSSLGSISFVWYLLHQNIGYIVMNELRKFSVTNEFLLVLIASLTTLLLSYIVSSLIKNIPSKIFA